MNLEDGFRWRSCLAWGLGLSAIAGLMTAGGANAAPGPCDASKMRQILEPVRRGNRNVVVDCNVNLQPGQIVTKQLSFVGRRSSGVTFKCTGGQIGEPRFSKRRSIMIQSRQRGAGGDWDAPERILIEGCQIFGSIIVFGMGRNSTVDALRRSSLQPGHTERARRAAPHDITLRRLKIVTTGGAALYLSPGVTRVTLEGSTLAGKSKSVALYLAPETAYNVIRNNVISKESKREQLAIDGSQHNLIQGNWFGALSTGGIFLYRNCGEDGMIRHTAPQRNRILSNIFYYRAYWGWNPAIWLASRNGNRSYCHLDKGYKFGSSASDRDFARHNRIIGNKFVERSPDQYIREDDVPNTIKGNSKISEAEAKAWFKRQVAR